MSEVTIINVEPSATGHSDGDEAPVVVATIMKQESTHNPMTDEIVATSVAPSGAFGALQRLPSVKAVHVAAGGVEGEAPPLWLQLMFLLSFCVFFGLVFVLPIVEIAYGGAYLGKNTNCNFHTDTFGSDFIPIWLIVNGVTTLVANCFLIGSMKTDPQDQAQTTPAFGCSLILIILFTSCWWFTGAIGFWGSCPTSLGAPLQPLMGAALITPLVFNCFFAGGRQ